MVIHFSLNGHDSACGRSGTPLSSSGNAADVSCKSCQRSLGKAEQPAVVKKATPSLADLRKPKTAMPPPPVQAPAPTATPPFNVASAWHQRLGALGSECRLPRGKARQRFV